LAGGGGGEFWADERWMTGIDSGMLTTGCWQGFPFEGLSIPQG